MAITKNDELNILKSFFEPMNLPEDKKQQRVDLAYELYAILTRLFVIIKASNAVGKFDRDYYIDYIIRNYEEVITGFGFDLDDDYFDFYIDMIADSIIDTTEKGKANALENSRAIEIAENDANAFFNHADYEEMIASGYKTKRWETMNDERVRFSHVMADGQEVPIDEPFTVGSSKMLYPMDVSLGATADEIVNCRCSCTYFK